MDDDLVHDVTWAPDSCDDQDGMEVEVDELADTVAKSERHEAEVVVEDFDDVRFVLDSMAGDSEVPDSQVGMDVKTEDGSHWCDRCN
ncbi:hypothetical protein E2562_017145 [Oryza meyeriana var. granulata]|uniref:Uncharacterized protein n=1 Tax=Oryza meyeriana var. granulata TaxID=110450 RepID=A0A6G1ELX0_9ORYZ|nr:hypothetical protein E2562_017145 [Oryza meyeriana var. granulata]